MQSCWTTRVLQATVAPLNLPNSLTVSRLVLTAVFVIGFTLGDSVGYGIALGAFTVAAITDFLDGYFARKLNLVTSLGKLLDPIADKVLTASAFIFLCAHEQHFCPAWAVESSSPANSSSPACARLQWRREK